jgi:hypothetical protein
MSKTKNGWSVIDAPVPFLTYTYSFGPGIAKALAVGIDGGLAVVSPPCGVGDGVYEDLAAFGEVKMLVGSNAFHYLGLPPWKARFPAAKIFAPAQSIARIEKKSGLTGIEPLAKAGVVTRNVELVDMPHYKTGEVLVRVSGGARPIWYVTDVLFNMPKLPPNPIFKMLFKLTDSAPGLKMNGIAAMFMVKDKPSLKQWLLGQVTTSPPSRVIFAHGDTIAVSPDASELKALFAS